MKVLISLLIAYLLGSIPFGVIIAKSKGIDLRKVGSGNIGATNVLRAAGKSSAVFTLIGDMLKGTGAVMFARYLGMDGWVLGAVCLVAVLGHNYPIFLKFHGGKGVATSFGVLLAYEPRVFLLTILLWILVVYLSRISALGALVSFSVMPTFMYLLTLRGDATTVGVLLTVMIYYRHRDNIRRLKEGKEPRLGKSK